MNPAPKGEPRRPGHCPLQASTEANSGQFLPPDLVSLLSSLGLDGFIQRKVSLKEVNLRQAALQVLPTSPRTQEADLQEEVDKCVNTVEPSEGFSDQEADDKPSGRASGGHKGGPENQSPPRDSTCSSPIAATKSSTEDFQTPTKEHSGEGGSSQGSEGRKEPCKRRQESRRWQGSGHWHKEAGQDGVFLARAGVGEDQTGGRYGNVRAGHASPPTTQATATSPPGAFPRPVFP